MDATFTDREIKILQLIEEYEEPLGAWNLAELLAEKGINIGTSTVGRTLNRLEKHGFLTKKQSNRGRTISEKGRAFLTDYRHEIQLKPLNKRLRDMLNTTVLEKFLMVLDARKALERAIARLAATHITEEQISRLESNVQERENRLRQSKSHADLDIAFHTGIANACGNQVLSLLYQTIATFGQQSELFQSLRQRVGSPYLNSHREILEALKLKDPDRAEECIVRHLDMLIGDVRKYWDTYFT